MATLNALKKAPILDQSGVPFTKDHTVTSSDTAVVAIDHAYNAPFYAVGVAAGAATVTAVRALDGATATLEVEVVAAVPFSISLGAESPA